VKKDPKNMNTVFRVIYFADLFINNISNMPRTKMIEIRIDRLRYSLVPLKLAYAIYEKYVVIIILDTHIL